MDGQTNIGMDTWMVNGLIDRLMDGCVVELNLLQNEGEL